MTNIWQRLKKPIFALAPMFGVTDSAFRQLVAGSGGFDLMFTEFTHTQAIFSPDNTALQQLTYSVKEQPLIAQIWGVDPEFFEAAADLIARMGFAGIDLNFGCPQKAVIKKGAGAALIETRRLAGEIIEAAIKGAAGRIPVSVKTRLGLKTLATESWLKFLLNFDLAAVTLHGRTAREMSKGPVHWGELTQAVRLRNRLKAKTLIIINGDLFSRQEADKKIAQTGADGAMIGRGVFKLIKSKSKTEKLALLRQHLDIYERTWGKTKSFFPLKRFFKLYAGGFKGALQLRLKLMETKSIVQVRDIIGQ